MQAACYWVSDKQSQRINSDTLCPAFIQVFILPPLLLTSLSALQPLLQVEISQRCFRGMAWCIHFKKRSLVRSLKIAQVGVMPCLAVTTEQPEHSPDIIWKDLPNPECDCLAFHSCLRTNWLIRWKSAWASLYRHICSTGFKKTPSVSLPSSLQHSCSEWWKNYRWWS